MSKDHSRDNRVDKIHQVKGSPAPGQRITCTRSKDHLRQIKGSPAKTPLEAAETLAKIEPKLI